MNPETPQLYLYCNSCIFQTSNRSALINHMKNVHKTVKTFKPCNQYRQNRCEFDSDCRFNHIILNADEVICFSCGAQFNENRRLLEHIKNAHNNIVCRNFVNKKCRYGNKCHYQHPIVQDREQVIQRVPPPSPQVQSSNNVNYSNSVSNAHNEQSFLYVTQPQGPPPGPQLTQDQIMMGLMSQIMPKIVAQIGPLIAQELKTHFSRI